MSRPSTPLKTASFVIPALAYRDDVVASILLRIDPASPPPTDDDCESFPSPSSSSSAADAERTTSILAGLPGAIVETVCAPPPPDLQSFGGYSV